MAKFETLITNLADGACRGDGSDVAECFTDDGIYHDCFYGSFERSSIKDMIENYFHRDAENLCWDMHSPVEAGSVGYARYVFSYDSRLQDARGERAVFEGVAICRLRDGLIEEYREVAHSISGLQQLGFDNQRLLKLLARESAELLARDESRHHVRRLS